MKKENEFVYKSIINNMCYNNTNYTNTFKYIYPINSIIHIAKINIKSD